MQAQQDIVIIGGGVIGSAIAYFLGADSTFNGSITVIEKDPTYEFGSTARSWGGIRQQFSTPENIRMSQFAQEFLGDITNRLSIDGTPVSVSYIERGYLFLVNERQLSVLYGNNSVQKSEGVNVALLDPNDLERGFPWLNISGLAGGSFGLSGEGWLDGYSLNQAFRKKAIALGANFQKDEAMSLEVGNNRVSRVFLKSGESLDCDMLVNAAGVGAAEVAGWAGIDLPVRPKKRFGFSFSCRTDIENCPLVIDTSGVHFRPEGKQFLAGCSPEPENDPDCTNFDIDYSWFEEHIWPILAHRVPAFEAIKLENAWAGHYAYNLLDQNAVLGPHPEIGNFYFANGFSGHGLQQSPAVGRALSELILYGTYRSLDLSRFSFERMVTGKPVMEHNIV